MPTPIERFVKLARKQVGKPYVHATAGPDSFDCSGLVWWCYNQIFEPDLNAAFRSSHHQWGHLGRQIAINMGGGGTLAALQPGDLLFYDTGTSLNGNKASHVGIYLGDNLMVNALNEGEGVVIVNVSKPYWTRRYLGARRIETGTVITTHPDIDVVTTTTVATKPELHHMLPFREFGDVSRERWREVLAGTPLESEADACYDAAAGHTLLALAMMRKESSLGRETSARNAKNPLGLLGPHGMMTFPSWALALAHWRMRITDPAYKGTPGPYFLKDVPGFVPGWGMSLLGFLLVYVGGPRCLSSKGQECAPDETYREDFPKDGASPNGGLVADDNNAPTINRYCAQVLRWMREDLGQPVPDPDPGPQPDPTGFQRIRFAGSTVDAYLPDFVRFKIDLTPVGNNRPGRRTVKTGTTQHETGNRRVGAGAEMHSAWQDNGTPGHPDGFIGVHFYVDDDVIIQKIPLNESSIHAGTRARNDAQISVERCVNPDQTSFEDSERNAAHLQAALLKYVLGTTALASMYPHYTPTGTGNCPVYIGQHWSAYENRVDRLIRELP